MNSYSDFYDSAVIGSNSALHCAALKSVGGVDKDSYDITTSSGAAVHDIIPGHDEQSLRAKRVRVQARQFSPPPPPPTKSKAQRKADRARKEREARIAAKEAAKIAKLEAKVAANLAAQDAAKAAKELDAFEEKCATCNFSTTKRGEWKVHIKSLKHRSLNGMDITGTVWCCGCEETLTGADSAMLQRQCHPTLETVDSEGRVAVDKNGSEEHCCLCGAHDGQTLVCCEQCPRGFCEPCCARLLVPLTCTDGLLKDSADPELNAARERAVQQLLADDNEWHCFECCADLKPSEYKTVGASVARDAVDFLRETFEVAKKVMDKGGSSSKILEDISVWKELRDHFAQERVQFVVDNMGAFEPFITPTVASALRSHVQNRGASKQLHQAGSKAKGGPDVQTQLEMALVPKTETIRDYQSAGVRWLLDQYVRGAGMVLADEMGLGKTMQATLFMRSVTLANWRGSGAFPHVVVTPLSVVGTWRRELQRWWPSCRVVVLQGDGRAHVKSSKLRLGTFDVCLTTCETMRSEKVWFSHGRVRWGCLVFDEAHKAKNEESDVSKAARRIPCLGRALLTGTPVQNNTHEVYALLNLLFPEAFTSSKVIDEAFDLSAFNPRVDEHLLSLLAQAMEPVMLRRTKKSVGLQLPEKTTRTVYVPLMPMQTFWYKALLTQELPQLGEAAAAKKLSKKMLENLVMQLRKCCNHPYSFQSAEPHPYRTGEHLVTTSGKLVALDKLLHDVLGGLGNAAAVEDGAEEGTDNTAYYNLPAGTEAGLCMLDGKRKRAPAASARGGCKRAGVGRKVVIFSSFTMTLDTLDEYLRLRRYSFLRLDGTTCSLQRQVDVEDFQRPGSPWQIYLVSTRAGGLGLTLTAADTVVLFDSNYNPQVDKQAMDRVHRIGQTRPVDVYRIISEGTVEESMLGRANRKLVLDAAVMGSEQGPADPLRSAGLFKDESVSQVVEMLMQGVETLECDAEAQDEGEGGVVSTAASQQFMQLTFEQMMERSRAREVRIQLASRKALQSAGTPHEAALDVDMVSATTDAAASDVDTRRSVDTAMVCGAQEDGSGGGLGAEGTALERLLKARTGNSNMFRGVDYNKVKALKRTSKFMEGDEEERIAQAWMEASGGASGQAGRATVMRMATVTLEGLGVVGEVPDNMVVECNMCLGELRKPLSNWMLFLSENTARVQKTLTEAQRASGGGVAKILGAMWQRMSATERAPYDNKAEKDRQRFVRQVADT
eukprot:gene5413-6564_t